jgi:hypothetical protein
MRRDAKRCRRLDLQHLIDVALRRHHEFEPRIALAKGGDRFWAQPRVSGNARMRELQGDVPLIDGHVRRSHRARGLDLDAVSRRPERVHEGRKGRMF